MYMYMYIYTILECFIGNTDIPGDEALFGLISFQPPPFRGCIAIGNIHHHVIYNYCLQITMW